MTATETKLTAASCCTPECDAAPRARKTFTPRTDIYETKGEVVILADVPGVDEKSVEITLEKDVLTLHAKAGLTNPEGFANGYFEYAEGDYERAFTLGDSLDREHIQAVVKNGVLRLVLPKATPAQARKIDVKAL